MSRNIEVTLGWGRTNLELTASTFPGGEEHIRLPKFSQTADCGLMGRLRNSTDVMRFILAADAMKRKGIKDMEAVIPYIPYARQDRVCNDGEALSLAVFANMINSYGFSSVTYWDEHSPVTSALIHNGISVAPEDLIHSDCALLDERYIVVAPDAGASKRAMGMAKLIGLDLIQATKVRDIGTTAIVETRISADLSIYDDKPYLIVDDICDGGRTFIELAKVLRGDGAKRIELYVTHGIFSKGLGVFEGLVDHIWTTDSICTCEGNAFLTIVNH